MSRTGTMEFQRKFREFLHMARTGPVEITRYGRRDLVLMSANYYDWLRAAVQRTHRTEDAAAVAIEAVQRAEMDETLAYLDELMN
jgi:prevent-host-death family protein